MSGEKFPGGQKASYRVVLFYSTSGTLVAEKILKRERIEYKLIPVPRHLSSDCGICLRFLREDEGRVMEAIGGKVEIQDIHSL
ncbi:MAG: DUF3343 domain-containing protein [Syntrophobacterales bacterium]|nr:MAG: DUF3343 domain-containing protein [Syntrophobacterales bacterium]